MFILRLQSELDMDVKNVLQYDPLYPIDCLEVHLREISLNDYRGKKPDIDFANFFVLNARMLKVMRFGIIYSHIDKWWVTQCKQL